MADGEITNLHGLIEDLSYEIDEFCHDDLALALVRVGKYAWAVEFRAQMALAFGEGGTA